MKQRVKRPTLHYSRFYFWLVVLAGSCGGYCCMDRVRHGWQWSAS